MLEISLLCVCPSVGGSAVGLWVRSGLMILRWTCVLVLVLLVSWVVCSVRLVVLQRCGGGGLVAVRCDSMLLSSIRVLVGRL